MHMIFHDNKKSLSLVEKNYVLLSRDMIQGWLLAIPIPIQHADININYSCWFY